MPFASPPAMPNVDFGGRLRAAVRFQGFSDPQKLNDVAATLYADLYMTRSDQPDVAVAARDHVKRLRGRRRPRRARSPCPILDAIAGFTPLPEFQIYAGRLLVMADRYAPSGPWSLDEWFYPGFFVRHAARRPEGGPVRARHGRRGLGRAARRSRQVLPGRLSIAGSGAVAAAQRSRAGQPALAASRGGFNARRTTATEISSPSASAARSRTTARS